MLATVGARELDDLFRGLPTDCRRSRPMELPEAMTEWELDRHMDALAGQMATAPRYKIFMGAGSYDHYIPASVSYLLGRSEFSTAYTPYQPEISQGTLQAIYEYQTLVTRLLGMEGANASMSDGASALAEALLMAIRITGRTTVAVSRAIHPLYRRVLQTYLNPTGAEVIELDYGPDGRTDLGRTAELPELAAIALQSPNFFGCIEDLRSAAQTATPTARLFWSPASRSRWPLA
jgi:glycine dehydrogenase subunit 1